MSYIVSEYRNPVQKGPYLASFQNIIMYYSSTNQCTILLGLKTQQDAVRGGHWPALYQRGHVTSQGTVAGVLDLCRPGSGAYDLQTAGLLLTLSAEGNDQAPLAVDLRMYIYVMRCRRVCISQDSILNCWP